MRKEIDELKHRLEFLLERTGSARGNTNRSLRYYGCIFIGCSETFDNKNDWKRHENSQHFHLEMWRCDEGKPEADELPPADFREHLKKALQFVPQWSHGQGRFWYGFCTKLIDLTAKAWVLGQNALAILMIISWLGKVSRTGFCEQERRKTKRR